MKFKKKEEERQRSGQSTKVVTFIGSRGKEERWEQKRVGLRWLPGCLDYLAGTKEGVKDECETKRWKNKSGSICNYRDSLSLRR